MTKTYEYVAITVRDYFYGEIDEYTEHFLASDHIGISNFTMNADEVVSVRHYTKTEKVSLWAWLRGFSLSADP